MGKKKRGGGKGPQSKQQRKEELQQRRERQQNPSDHFNPPSSDSFYPGNYGQGRGNNAPSPGRANPNTGVRGRNSFDEDSESSDDDNNNNPPPAVRRGAAARPTPPAARRGFTSSFDSDSDSDSPPPLAGRRDELADSSSEDDDDSAGLPPLLSAREQQRQNQRNYNDSDNDQDSEDVPPLLNERHKGFESDDDSSSSGAPPALIERSHRDGDDDSTEDDDDDEEEEERRRSRQSFPQQQQQHQQQQQQQQQQRRSKNTVQQVGFNEEAYNDLPRRMKTRNLLRGDRAFILNPLPWDEKIGNRATINFCEKAGPPTHAITYHVAPIGAPSSFSLMPYIIQSDAMLVDDYPVTLRFNRGDKAVAKLNTKWCTVTVDAIYPAEGYDRNEDEVPAYRVRLANPRIHGFDASQKLWYARLDNNDHIRPLLTTLRFRLGDAVLISMSKADIEPPKNAPSWVRGKVVAVSTNGGEFRYRCQFSLPRKNKKPLTVTCLCLEDTDEHIASVRTPPRQRLFDAIEQNCGSDHLDFLVEEYDLDVAGYTDALLEAAVKAANYDALAWLGTKHGVSLMRADSLDGRGGGLLHSIATSPHAERFFERALQETPEDSPSIEFTMDDVDEDYGDESPLLFLNAKDQDGRYFVSRLIESGNLRALELVLSWRALDPMSMFCIARLNKKLFGHDFGCVRRWINEVAGASVRVPVFSHLFDSFERNIFLYWLHLFLGTHIKATNQTKIIKQVSQALKDDDVESTARRFVGYCNLVEGIDAFLCSCSAKGQLSVVDWLFDLAENTPPTIRWSRSIMSADRYEFGQLEMFDLHRAKLEESADSDEKEEELDIISVTVHGRSHRFSGNGSGLNVYRNRVLRPDSESFDLKKELLQIVTKKCYPIKNLAEAKLSLLSDDADLEKRIGILRFLVTNKGQRPPQALDAIRFRQNGILRWLCSEEYIHLDKPACKSRNLLRWSRDLPRIFNSSKIERLPKTISVASVLLFACVEYDDLQSLQWILQKAPSSINAIMHGWAPIHVIAFFGRTEIFLSLKSWNVSFEMNQVSQRTPWKGYNALHLAVSRGFTDLADDMIRAGSVLKSKGESIAEIAKKTGIEHVKVWGASRARSDDLEAQVSKLSKLISQSAALEVVKKHIQATSCLRVIKWKEDFDVHNAVTKCPSGKSLADVLSALYDIADSTFILWLLNEFDLERSDIYYASDFWGIRSTKDKTSAAFMAKDKILNVMSRHFEKDVVRILKTRVVKRLRVKDPMTTLPDPMKWTLDFFQHRKNSKMVASLKRGLLELGELLSVAEEAASELDKVFHGEIFLSGGSVKDAEEIVKAFVPLSQCIQRYQRQAWGQRSFLISADGRVRADGKFYVRTDYALSKMFSLERAVGGRADVDLTNVLATEGHVDLMRWTLLPNQNTWTDTQEVGACRIASFFGHSAVTDLLLYGSGSDISFKSDVAARKKAAVLGAAERNDFETFLEYLEMAGGYDIFTRQDSQPDENEDNDRIRLLASSPAGSAVAGFIRGPPSTSNKLPFELLSYSANRDSEAPEAMVEAAMTTAIFSPRSFQTTKRCFDVFQMVVATFDLKARAYSDVFQGFLDIVLRVCSESAKGSAKDADKVFLLLEEALGFLILNGVDFQKSNSEETRSKSALDSAKKNQLDSWARFKNVHKMTIEKLKASDIPLDAYDQNGLTLIHLAAAHDRKDLVVWLHEQKGAPLSLTDDHGRSVLEVAKASGATNVSAWVQRQQAAFVIGRFVLSLHRVRKEQQRKERILRGIKRFQALHRGIRSRRLNRGCILKRLALVSFFKSTWGEVVSSFPSKEDTTLDWVSWASMKSANGDIAQAQEFAADLKEIAESSLNVAKSLERSLTADAEEVEENQDEFGLPLGEAAVDRSDENQQIDLTPPSLENLEKIQMTKEVVKWCRNCHPTYREFFLRRLKQLASGDRSRILAKGLVGSKTRIFETYLEQKSGFRILWTKMPDSYLRIWYVAKHDDVSRLITLIDRAEERSTRSLVSALSQFNTSEEELRNNVVLDPFGNTPMKLYEVQFSEVDQLLDSSWSPPLYLTPEERSIVQTTGTVLLFGRSGTGKTVCICNRMDYDWRLKGANPTFSQLFVSRSAGLRRFVRDTVTGFDAGRVDDNVRSFLTFEQLIQRTENKLSEAGIGDARTYLSSQKMTYPRFLSEVYSPGKTRLGAKTIFRNIHTFLKGSAEALLVQDGGCLSKEAYFGLGSKHCRLSREQREEVYAAYEKYKAFVDEQSLWDDSDRVRHLITRMRMARDENSPVWDEIRRSKIYVDEVQDYTQAEILLFFLMSGPDSLFLAGDPAQSVAEGTDFRFKDIRAVGYSLFGESQKDLIPNKPKIVSLNFRSHTGVLRIASAVLECMFRAFPESSESQKHDRGFFEGPRPGMFYKVSSANLYELSQRVDQITFLTYDDHVHELRQALNQYQFVYGIRDAKGLEFQAVVLVDLFGKIPEEKQKRWRDLLLGRDLESLRHEFPGIETDLKLMYTGVTRCMNSLWFAERKPSIAGEAALRWLTTSTVDAWQKTGQRKGEYKRPDAALAVRQVTDDVEAMTRTSDEWIIVGLDNAIMAEQDDVDPNKACDWLDRALYCFEKSGDKSWGSKARSHKAGAELLLKLHNHKKEVKDTVKGDDELDETRRELEMEATEQIIHLLEARLILEAKRILDGMWPVLSDYTRDRLQNELLPIWPSDADLQDLV